jgi:hypothetical protein
MCDIRVLPTQTRPPGPRAYASVHFPRTSSRCQRRSVCGFSTKPLRRCGGSRRTSAASNALRRRHRRCQLCSQAALALAKDGRHVYLVVREDTPREQIARLSLSRDGIRTRSGGRSARPRHPESASAPPRARRRRAFAKRDLALLVQRPRGTRIPVERRPDASRIDDQRSVRPRPPELAVAVTEQDRSLGFAREQPLLAGLASWREALDIGKRRTVADEDPVELRSFRKAVQPLDDGGAERLARRRHRRRDHLLRALRHFRLVAEPTVDVSTDAGDGRQSLQELDRLARPRPERGVVAPRTYELTPARSASSSTAWSATRFPWTSYSNAPALTCDAPVRM